MDSFILKSGQWSEKSGQAMVKYGVELGSSGKNGQKPTFVDTFWSLFREKVGRAF